MVTISKYLKEGNTQKALDYFEANKFDIAERIRGDVESRLLDVIRKTQEFKSVSSKFLKMTIGERIEFLRRTISEEKISEKFPELVGRTSQNIDEYVSGQGWTREKNIKLNELTDEAFDPKLWADTDLRRILAETTNDIPATLKLRTDPNFWTRNVISTQKPDNVLRAIKSQFSSTNKKINVRVATKAEANDVVQSLIDDGFKSTTKPSITKDSFLTTTYGDNVIEVRRDFSGGKNQPWVYPDGTEIIDVPPHINLNINEGRYEGAEIHIFIDELATLSNKF